MEALEVLTECVAAWEPWLRSTGELDDPVFGRPTQYSTAYFSYANAVLAERRPDHHRATAWLQAALLGVDATLRYMADPFAESPPSHFDRLGSVTMRDNARDFCWPAVLKSHRIVTRLAPEAAKGLAVRIRGVDIEAAVKSSPPNNWASVWLSGEWLRYRDGLSPYPLERFDHWLAPFFRERIELEMGFYQEPGHPNSYDLFTRFHLADMVRNGYAGRWLDELRRLLDAGGRRSLAVQLSDGSLASAHRSTGQTWTLGAQCALFTLLECWWREEGDEKAAGDAAEAHDRALESLLRWRDAEGRLRPVENLLPSAARVGYEPYTADAHYSALALGFLADAVHNHAAARSTAIAGEARPVVFVEGEPVYRGLVRSGPYSAHVNGFPAAGYDAFGVSDMTFGPGRFLHFVSSPGRQERGERLNIGVVQRSAPGPSPLLPLLDAPLALVLPPRAWGVDGLEVEARPAGRPFRCRLQVRATEQGILIEEATPAHALLKSLLVPYLRDPGGGSVTLVEYARQRATFTLDDEVLGLELDQEVESVVDLPLGFESRRGLCGVLRLDIRWPTEVVSYRLERVR